MTYGIQCHHLLQHVKTTMPKTAKISSRIEPALKNKGDAILSSIGLSASEAITMFYHQIVIHRGLPFSANIPNDETVAAINELKDPEYRASTKRYNSVDALMADLTS